jgi:hypothetical protein
MRFSRMVIASGCQCRSRNSPGFDPSVLRSDTVESEGQQMKQCGLWNNVHKKIKTNPL